MGNTNYVKGNRVAAVKEVRVLNAGFPGWGSDNYRDFLASRPAGVEGVIRNVESHGSNPWTRYSVTWDDGSTSSGVLPDQITAVR